LWHERIATNDALAYVEMQDDESLRIEAYRVLFPAYGTYVGSSLGDLYPPLGASLFVGGLLTGHAAGRWQTSRWAPDRFDSDTDTKAVGVSVKTPKSKTEP